MLLQRTLEAAEPSSFHSREEALLPVLRAISAHRDPKALFQVLAGELRRVVEFDFLGLFLYDEATNRIQMPLLETIKGPGFAIPMDFPPEETITWWVYHNQQPVVISSSDHEIRFPRLMELYKQFGVQSSCVLPLTTAHRRLGSLGLAVGHFNAYSAEEVRFLSLVADQVALAVDNALHSEASERAQAESQREKERLQLLLDLYNSVVSSLGLPELLHAISTNARRVMRCDYASLPAIVPIRTMTPPNNVAA